MILHSVGLENFGLYQGEVVLDLTPASDPLHPKPVILVGGRNGVGKTTLLEAVRLALYGKRALGTRVGQAQYEEYLRSRIHRPASARRPPTGASVSIEFDFAEDGVVQRYRVRRAWQARGRTVAESLEVTRDTVPLTDVPRDEWHSFIQDMIPPGVSQLFFFDGERIQEIADGDHDEEHLASAIRSLLGIDTISRLRTDLGLYLSKHQRGEHSEADTKLQDCLAELATLDEQISVLAEALGQLSVNRESEGRVAEHLRRRFVAEGGDLAARRSQLLSEREELRSQISARIGELREAANRLLPLTVAPNLTRRFRSFLRDAETLDHAELWPQAAAALQDSIGDWRVNDVPARSARWDDAHWSDLLAFVGNWAARRPVALRLSVSMSSSDRTRMLTMLDEADGLTRLRLEVVGNDLERLQMRERELSSYIQRADEGASNAVLDELLQSEQRVGAAEAMLRAREEELKVLHGRRNAVEREKERALEQQASRVGAERRATLAAKASQALAEYERRLLEKKVDQLRSEVVHCFNRLARKGEILSDVRIDVETFGVTLVDREGREVPKAALSAGEKQIYAIAMLWALARTSGRALPMIVDTPLARLDTEHRSNLVTRYFAEASHQVILLSTDTEVDAGVLSALQGSISRAWLLEYDSTSGSTSAKPGYFWDTELHVSTDEELLVASSH